MTESILVGLCTPGDEEFEYCMDEMTALAEACDMQVVAKAQQCLPSPNPATYVGSGKLEELSELVQNMGIGYLLFADNLSPAQLKNIQRKVDAVVLDRTSLILKIFAERAKTREARLQVEMADLQYMLPRLVGMRTSLGRQGGTGGSMSNKGSGEKQIELDRRRIEHRISELRRDLESIEHDRNVQRKARSRGNLPCVALVGYTNAGKSTLMNHLAAMSGAGEEKQVEEKDMLFATLDTSVRRISTGDKKDFLLADTVGFVSNLPHGLVQSFRTTLDEVRLADLLLIVVDCVDPHSLQQIKVTEETLKELGADRIPRIRVMNKADLLQDLPEDQTELPFRPVKLPHRNGDTIYLSAASNTGLSELLDMIKERVYANNRIMHLLIPYQDGAASNLLNESASILDREYTEAGIRLVADCPSHLIGRFEKYLI